MTVAQRAAHLAELAREWQDPDYDSRTAAVEAALEVDGRYTEEGLAFALNHRMHQFAGDELNRWIGDSESARRNAVVGISYGHAEPLAGLSAVAASLVFGHGLVVESPTPLVAALAEELAERIDAELHAAPRPTLLAEADAWLVGCRPHESEAIHEQASVAKITEDRLRIETVGNGVVVLDGGEDHAALSGLAEDLLLHDGLAPSTPRIVWAPSGMSPDPLLNVLAGFRELYPAHPETDGTLAMPTAFLVAAGQSHATGPGFLVSLGEPEAQAPAHIRWAEYDDLGDVERWIGAQHPAVSSVIAAPALADRLSTSVPIRNPGDVHRPPLDPALPAFLRSL